MPMASMSHEMRASIDGNEPFYIEDITVEDGCQLNQILFDQRVTTSLKIPIRGQDRPYGFLGVYTRQVRTFSPDDIFFLQTISNVLASTMAFEQSKAAIEARNRKS